MKAVVLAAGEGSRLRPLTLDRPKCMVELRGKALLDYQLELFREAGIHSVHVITGYRAECIDRPGIIRHHNPRYASTNMVYTLFRAAEVFSGDQDIIVSYGDIVYNAEVLQRLMACEAPVGVVVDLAWRAYWEARMEDPLRDAETLRMKEKDRIVELGRKPRDYSEIEGQYIGLIKVKADYTRAFVEVWRGMDQNACYDGQDFDNMYMTSFLQALIHQGWDVRAVFINNGWLEIDRLADLEVDVERFLER